MTEARTRARMKFLAILVLFMFGAITTRLWFLQVLAAPRFARQANQNQVRLVPLDPMRGVVLDRAGNILVGNRSSTVVLVDRRGMQGHDEEVLYRLSNLLHMKVQDILNRLNSVKYLPYQPVPVAEDVPSQDVFYIEEHSELFPGVSYAVEPVRSYPNGDSGAQMFGYVGEVTSRQLKDPAFKGYLPGELVGQSGIEEAYEPFLHGTNGTREIQVNAQGHILNPDFNTKPAVPGDDVVLSIDRDVQNLSEQSLSLGIKLARRDLGYRATGGAVIVMNPRNGQILSLASNPGYNPAMFQDGLSKAEARTLLAPQANNPLLDRAAQGLYPAGSTFKPFVAMAALKERFVSEHSSLNCPAQWVVPTDPSHPFHNWDPRDSGYLTIPQALTVSCDTVFYQLGYDFWLKYHHSGTREQFMQNDLGTMGFGRLTGIDLPGELPGLIPTYDYIKRVYRRDPKVYGHFYGWLPGDAVNLSIGQGFIQVTPLQLADAYAAIANGGTLWQPHVALKVQRPDGTVVQRSRPKRIGSLPIPKSEVLWIRDALTNVPKTGTASFAFQGFPLDRIPVAGKTGTADILPKQPVSWFAAMAPANNPKYVVVAMVEQGGHGATTAAPIVRRILEGLFGMHPGKIAPGTVAD
jgi:penicillin-binding protein 2